MAAAISYGCSIAISGCKLKRNGEARPHPFSYDHRPRLVIKIDHPLSDNELRKLRTTVAQLQNKYLLPPVTNEPSDLMLSALITELYRQHKNYAKITDMLKSQDFSEDVYHEQQLGHHVHKGHSLGF